MQSETGVDHVGTGQPQVNEPGGVPHRFTGRSQERDDIVVGFEFDLSHAFEIATCVSDRDYHRGRNAATNMPRLANRDLDTKPGGDLRFVAPDASHCGPGVTADQRSVPPASLEHVDLARRRRVG